MAKGTRRTGQSMKTLLMGIVGALFLVGALAPAVGAKDWDRSALVGRAHLQDPQR